jgi:hypothetical protein
MENTGQSSRRTFIAGGVAAIAATSLAGCSAGGAGTMGSSATGGTASQGPLLTTTQADEWDRLVGNAFMIETETGRAQATLAAVQRGDVDINRPASLSRDQSFMAFFEMDSRSVPEGDKTYRVSHAARGAFDLFLGAPGEARGKSVLVAVLN